MEIPYEVTPRRDTGLYNAKLGVWLFLASEVMLFGGLFSAYVFLRVGVQEGFDNPWPLGLNVHKGFVWIGFANTLVLIFSSVGVVFAWVALKERNWRRFQVWMWTVVGCAAFFMAMKTIEYHSKLYLHHGIKLVDNSVMEGKILDRSDRIDFKVDTVSFGLQGALPVFLGEVEGEFPTLTVQPRNEGAEPREISSKSEFKRWFHSERRAVSRELASDRRRYRAELAADPSTASPVRVSTSATLTAAEPFPVSANPRKVMAHDAENINYRDGSKVAGELVRDDVLFEVHEVDMQLVLPQNQRDSLLWEIVDDEGAKREFFSKQQQKYEKLRSYYEARGELIPERMLRGSMLNLHSVHLGGGDRSSAGDDEPAQQSASQPDAAGEDGGYGMIAVPRDQIKFMGNHGPRYGNYYAIYFTMTALHGLHVVGGALVLLYFLLFGKKLFLKNPEHLANRVEVGGLFWHFVDLVWIFLFPVMYLF